MHLQRSEKLTPSIATHELTDPVGAPSYATRNAAPATPATRDFKELAKSKTEKFSERQDSDLRRMLGNV